MSFPTQLFEHLPPAVSSDLIIDPADHERQRGRALSVFWYIIDRWFINDHINKALDFGCGRGYNIEPAEVLGIDMCGYDPKPAGTFLDKCTDNWDEIESNGPYDLVIAHDVFDHIANDDERIEALQKIKTVLSETGKLFIRFHPYTSRTGAHQYYKANQSHIHLLLSEEEKCSINIATPELYHIKYPAEYRPWLEESGFAIEEYETIIQKPPDFGPLKDRLLQYWSNQEEYDKIFEIISISFIDCICHVYA